MPRKTRRQKKHISAKTGFVPAIKGELDSQAEIKSQIRTDLRKTVILTLVLFALEFLIFYANLK